MQKDGTRDRAIAFILAACEFVILSDRGERRISFVLWNKILRPVLDDSTGYRVAPLLRMTV